jgi:hypothetical protein
MARVAGAEDKWLVGFSVDGHEVIGILESTSETVH